MQQLKITVNKNDEATLVAEKLIDAKATEIILTIPRFSKFAESEVNFRLIKREAEELDKKLVIESIDDEVIAQARANGIECVNPFFTQSAKQVSDIVKGKPHTKKVEKQVHKKVASEPAVASIHHAPKKQKRIRVPRIRVGGLRTTAVVIIFLVIVVGGLFLGVRVLPHATINITAATLDRSYSDSVTVDNTLTALDLEALRIPGQVFMQKKNLQLSFPASGKKNVQQKAEGTITVYNAHSSDAQGLVKNTRFETPDGKVYRLIGALTVPGAIIEDGQIVPSSINAPVIADKAGADFNIGPVTKFSIPGFSGSPKFKTFYGSSAGAMTGGLVGEIAYPSDDDLEQAEAVVAETLETSMRDLMRAQIPSEFKIIDGATTFTLLDTSIDTSLNESDQFTIFGEAEISMVGFREDDLLALFVSKAEEEAEVEFDVREYSLTYGTGSLASAESLVVPIEYHGVLSRKIDETQVKDKIAGKAEGELRSLIFSLPGLQSAHISLWPFWVRKVPQDIEKIEISVD